MNRPLVDAATAEKLRCYAERYETEAFLDGDPSWWMHQVTGDSNREATAFVASCLSYGSRIQFMPKIGQLLEWASGDMEGWIRSGAFEQRLQSGDSHCYYRLYSCELMHDFLEAYRQLLATHGSLGAYVKQNACDGFGAVEAVCRYFAHCGISVVVPKDTSSACKRVCMFLRWMVRDGSPVDIGLWSDFIDRRSLIMPLDTHVLSEAERLGLLSGRVASMSAARRLTETLATVFPDDPLKGDFALFGFGISESR